MSVPTHREDCQTRTWKTTCPDCKKPVWFFSCTCGSKVFFDAKGYPWPLHGESCPIYHIRGLIDAGSDPKQIRKVLESEARLRNTAIPVDIDEYLARYGASGKVYYQDVLPSDELCEVDGVVHHIDRINFFKRADLDDNLIIRKMLGELADQLFVEIVIREIGVKGSRFLKRWTFVVPESEATGAGLRLGMHAFGTLETKIIIDDYVVWLAKSLDWK
jgi:hypothetical protein